MLAFDVRLSIDFLCQHFLAIIIAIIFAHIADANDEHDRTALIYACHQGHVEAARLLLEKGAAVDAKDGRGGTALMQACMAGQVEAARLVLEAGADRSLRMPDGRMAADLVQYAPTEEAKAQLRALLA